MRALTVVVVTACSSASPKAGEPLPPMQPPQPVAAADAAVDAAAEQEVTTDYTLPDVVEDALAKETVQGNVLVPTTTELYPSAKAAREQRSSYYTDPDKPVKLMALRVIKDHGDVIEVSTDQDEKDTPIDCEPSLPLPYVLTVFVRRAKLTLRSTVAQSQTYPDGTVVTIDAGAAIEVTPKGLAWRTPLLAATKLAPRQDQLAYSGPRAPVKGALAAMPGEQLFCDDEWNRPMTAAEAPKPKPGEKLYECGAFDPPDLNPENKSLPPPTIGGAPIPWDSFVDETFRVHRQPDKRVLADIESKCGRVRMQVDPGAINTGGLVLEVDDAEDMLWVPAKGPVTWEDGTPAGRFVGATLALGPRGLEHPRKVPDKKPTMLCTSVRPVIEWLCHPLRTSKRKKVKPIRDVE